jgi:hypothetical protein
MSSEVMWYGTGVLTEQANSPRWEFGETARATQVFKGMYEIARASAVGKGVLGTGEFNGMKVASCTVERERGEIGVLTIVWEGLVLSEEDPEGDSIQLPPDEVELDHSLSEIDIKKLPQYSDLTKEDLWAIEAWIGSADFQTQEFLDWMETSENVAIIRELRDNLQRGETHKLLYPPVVRWTSYFVNPPPTTEGGFLEYPSGAPINVPSAYQYLRAGDSLSKSGSFWKLTRTWIGAEQWNPTIYF